MLPVMRAIAWVLIFLGAVVGTVGIYLGTSSVTRYATDCGSAFSGGNRDAFSADIERATLADASGLSLDASTLTRTQDACGSALSDRKTLAWVVTVPGVALVAAGMGLSVASRRELATV